MSELFAQLRSQPLRSILTLSSVAWGTVAIVLLLAFGQGFRERFRETSEGIGRGMVVVWPGRTTIPHEGQGIGRPIRLTPADLSVLDSAVPGLLAVSAEFSASRVVKAGERRYRVGISGVEPEFALLRNVLPRNGGRFVSARDVAERRRVAFLGDRIARRLFDGDAVGGRVMLGGSPYIVIGVLDPKEQDSDYGGKDADRVWIPWTTFADVFGQRDVDDFVFAAKESREHGRVVSRVRQVLGEAHGFDRSDTGALYAWDQAEEQAMVDSIFLAMNVMFGVSGVFTLVVGGVGVAHLMFLLVRRRTPEIGLCIAVGARPAAILRQVLAQSLVLVAIGGVVGFAFSGFAIAAVRSIGLEQSVGTPYVSPSLALGTAGALALLGLIAGWAPARAASRLDAIVALRS